MGEGAPEFKIPEVKRSEEEGLNYLLQGVTLKAAYELKKNNPDALKPLESKQVLPPPEDRTLEQKYQHLVLRAVGEEEGTKGWMTREQLERDLDDYFLVVKKKEKDAVVSARAEEETDLAYAKQLVADANSIDTQTPNVDKSRLDNIKAALDVLASRLKSNWQDLSRRLGATETALAALQGKRAIPQAI